MDFSFLRVLKSGGGLPRKILPLGLVMLKNCFKYNWPARTWKKPALPRAVCLFVTYRCNLRCRMCGIWRHSDKVHEDEMSLRKIEKYLSDPLLKKLEFVNINGGEPNLRKDLAQVGELIIKKTPGLKALSINTNGLPPERAVANARAIASLCLSRKVRFSISLSLHDVGRAYDRIAGIEGGYEKVMDTMSGLREIKDRYGLYLSANCVITPLNSGHLDRVLEWSQRMNIPVNFVLGEIRERFQNYGMERDTLIGDENREEIISFLRKLAVRKEIFFHHALRYETLANMLEFDSERKLACYYALGGAVIGSDGALSYCPHSKEIGYAGDRSLLEIYFDPSNLRYLKESLRRDRCPKCPSYNFNRMEVEKDLWKVIKYLVLTK
jgi:MoaA/NifB/PqqE/SkfB family radical SAM enzyme